MEMNMLNTAAALEMLSGEKELYIMLLDAFIESCPDGLDQIDAFISEDKFEEARAYSHKIKGSASQIGAEQLTFALQYLEDTLKGKTIGDVKSLAKNAEYVFQKTLTYVKEFRNTF